MDNPPETNQAAPTDTTADDEPELSLTTLQPTSAQVVPYKGKPGSPQMIDPEGKIRSGQFRGNARIARHPSHRPYEKD